jgi:hypothetical protein
MFKVHERGQNDKMVINNTYTFKVFYLPTDAQEKCFKRNIKIYIKTAPTWFGLITIIRECTIQAC